MMSRPTMVEYDFGATDTAIKIGDTLPYSGPASAYGIIGKLQAAYFNMINERGGINGRKIDYISYDDGSSPQRAVEQTRKLVESDEVLFIIQPVNKATPYLNSKKVPQLFIGADRKSEAHIYGTYLAKNHPHDKIAVLYADDEDRQDRERGLKQGLGDKVRVWPISGVRADAARVHIARLEAMRVTILVNFTTPKFTAEAIRRMLETGWKPAMHILASASLPFGTVLKQWLENSTNIVSTNYLKDPDDPDWSNDPGMKTFLNFLERAMPNEDKNNNLLVYSYTAAQGIVALLKKCGDDLTRDNVMKQAENMEDIKLDLLLPGITLNAWPGNHLAVNQMQLTKFDGERWVRFGSVMEGAITID